MVLYHGIKCGRHNTFTAQSIKKNVYIQMYMQFHELEKKYDISLFIVCATSEFKEYIEK